MLPSANRGKKNKFPPLLLLRFVAAAFLISVVGVLGSPSASIADSDSPSSASAPDPSGSSLRYRWRTQIRPSKVLYALNETAQHGEQQGEGVVPGTKSPRSSYLHRIQQLRQQALAKMASKASGVKTVEMSEQQPEKKLAMGTSSSASSPSVQQQSPEPRRLSDSVVPSGDDGIQSNRITTKPKKYKCYLVPDDETDGVEGDGVVIVGQKSFVEETIRRRQYQQHGSHQHQDDFVLVSAEQLGDAAPLIEYVDEQGGPNDSSSATTKMKPTTKTQASSRLPSSPPISLAPTTPSTRKTTHPPSSTTTTTTTRPTPVPHVTVTRRHHQQQQQQQLQQPDDQEENPFDIGGEFHYQANKNGPAPPGAPQPRGGGHRPGGGSAPGSQWPMKSPQQQQFFSPPGTSPDDDNNSSPFEENESEVGGTQKSPLNPPKRPNAGPPSNIRARAPPAQPPPPPPLPPASFRTSDEGNTDEQEESDEAAGPGPPLPPHPAPASDSSVAAVTKKPLRQILLGVGGQPKAGPPQQLPLAQQKAAPIRYSTSSESESLLNSVVGGPSDGHSLQQLNSNEPFQTPPPAPTPTPELLPLAPTIRPPPPQMLPPHHQHQQQPLPLAPASAGATGGGVKSPPLPLPTSPPAAAAPKKEIPRDARGRPLILSPDNCRMVDYYSRMYGVSDVKAFVHKNCSFAKMYLPQASCAEIDVLVASCYDPARKLFPPAAQQSPPPQRPPPTG